MPIGRRPVDDELEGDGLLEQAVSASAQAGNAIRPSDQGRNGRDTA